MDIGLYLCLPVTLSVCLSDCLSGCPPHRKSFENTATDCFHNRHNYIVVNEGRMYVAFSPIPNEVGDALQTILPVATIVGWMFAMPANGLKNGLQLTGEQKKQF